MFTMSVNWTDGSDTPLISVYPFLQCWVSSHSNVKLIGSWFIHWKEVYNLQTLLALDIGTLSWYSQYYVCSYLSS